MAPIGFQSFFPPGGTNLLLLPGWNLETKGGNVWNVQFFGTMETMDLSLPKIVLFTRYSSLYSYNTN